MRLVRLTRDRLLESADVLARAMADESSLRWVLPDDDEFLDVYREVDQALIAHALEDGHVDGWGEPLVGIAVWLRRPRLVTECPSMTAPPLRRATDDIYPAHAIHRVERYSAIIRQLRQRARPDEHAYLDSIAVLPGYRRHGIATHLLGAGHEWADSTGLPCALDTASDRSVAFYERRGYRRVAELPLADSGLTITAMRRPRPDRELD